MTAIELNDSRPLLGYRSVFMISSSQARFSAINTTTITWKGVYNRVQKHRMLDINEKNGLLMSQLYRSTIEYWYWNDPNELCERLLLLIYPKRAGHTGLDDVIILILE